MHGVDLDMPMERRLPISRSRHVNGVKISAATWRFRHENNAKVFMRVTEFFLDISKTGYEFQILQTIFCDEHACLGM